MTPDPTTRDPAASLRACIELAAKATPGPWVYSPERNTHDSCIHTENAVPEFGYIGEKGGVVGSSEWIWLSDEDANAIVACVNAIRDAAPALLAEVAALRLEAATLEGHLAQAMQTVADMDREAEAAEKSLGEAVALLRHWADDAEAHGYAADAYPLVGSTRTFLAHHGARTGENNE